MNITRYEAAGLHCVEVAPLCAKNKDLPLVINLHGWGDWGEFYTLLAPLINNSAYRFVFPTGPNRVPGAFFSWFNLEFKDMFLANLAPQVAKARDTVTALIDALRQRYNLPANRVALGGFSLGGMVSLDVGLRYPEKLAGLYGLSSFLVADSEFNIKKPTDMDSYYRQDRGDLQQLLRRAAANQLPVLVAHGMFDFMIPTPAGAAYYRQLKAAGVPAELYEFWGGHQFTLDELVMLNSYLERVFGSN